MTKVTYTPEYNRATEKLQVIVNLSFDSSRILELKTWQVEELFSAFRQAQKNVIELTGAERETLDMFQTWGFVRWASHTQLEWTNKGAESIVGYLQDQAKA